MATLLYPKLKLMRSFSYGKEPLNLPDFPGPLVAGLMGIHCIYKWYVLKES